MRNARSVLVALVLAASSFTTGCATSGSTDDGLAELDGEAASAGSFGLWQSTDGQFRFHLKAGNGSILLTSEGYTSRTAAIAGILSVQTNGVDDLQYRVVKAASGHLVHLVAGNGETIATSQVYASKGNATRAIGAAVRAVTTYLDKREGITAGARLELAVGATGQFHWNVHAKNGQVVVTSEHYTTEAAALNGAYLVQERGRDLASYQIKQNAAGGFYFTIDAANGEIIGVSQAYTTRASAQTAVHGVIELLPSVFVL